MKELSPEDRHDRAKVNEAVRQAKESGSRVNRIDTALERRAGSL